MGKRLCRSGLSCGAALLALSALAIPASPAAAKTAEADVADDAQAALTGAAPIVVTATRREERLEKVPVSVAVVDGDTFRTVQAGGDDILAISGRVPGVYAESTTGRIFPRFYIRGLGNIDFYLGASQPVSIIQDEVVLEHVVMKSNPVYDTAQIEVLRGPQGTLFGRNTPAGIIKFESIRPSFDWRARVSGSYGTYNSVTFDAGIGGPLVRDKVAFRISGLYQHRDDWVDNLFAGQSADGTRSPRKNAMGGFTERDMRLQLLVKADEKLSILFSGHARDFEGTATLFRRAALIRGSNAIIAAQRRDAVAYDEGQDNPQAYKSYGVSSKIAYDFGAATLTSVSAWETLHGFSRGDTDGGAAADYPVNGVPNGFGQSMGRVRSLDQYSQELRLASNGTGKFKWQFGGLYFDSTDITEFYQRGFFLNPPARNPNNWVRLRNRNHSWGVFGQISYALTPALTMSVGGRVSNDTKITRLLKTADTAAGLVTYRGRTRVRLADTQPSFDASLLYVPHDRLSVYARIATGFRGPTIQGRSAVFNADFTTANSEKILSGEIGFKSRLADNRVRLNGSVFAYRMHDIQLNGNDSNGNGVLFNAEKAVAYGAELEADINPTRTLWLSAGLSLLHSAIRDKRVYAQVCALNGVVVCTVLNPTIRIGSNSFAQINGEPLPNAPRYNVNLAARYDMPLRNGGKFFVGGDFNIQGYTQYVLYNTREFNSDGNFELGAKLGYAAPDNQWELALFARNLTAERNLKGVIENYMAAVFNEPRIFGLSFSGKFR